MNKSLIALPALAIAGMAFAQSSVTLYGVVDTSLQRVSNSGGAHGRALASSGYNGSRLGFRGTEDLGGGMSTSFQLEAALFSDDGQGGATNSNNQASGAGAAVAGRQGLIFNRRSIVSVASGWGELRLGRDYTPQAWNQILFDPFGAVGLGGSHLYYGAAKLPNSQTSLRASNTIGYFLPRELGGFYGQLQYYLGENSSTAANSDDGRGGGVRVGWAQGPFEAALAFAKTAYLAGDFKQSNLGASYNFGMAKLMLIAANDKSGPVTAKGWQIGASVPVGVGEIRVAYDRYKSDATVLRPTSSKLALSYVHNLSKRTALYATYARIGNSGGAAAAVGNFGAPAVNGSSTGYDAGIRHTF